MMRPSSSTQFGWALDSSSAPNLCNTSRPTIIKLRSLLSEHGDHGLRGVTKDNFMSRIHDALRRAVQSGEIQPKRGTFWSWLDCDEDLKVVRHIVAEEVSRLRCWKGQPRSEAQASQVSIARHIGVSASQVPITSHIGVSTGIAASGAEYLPACHNQCLSLSGPLLPGALSAPMTRNRFGELGGVTGGAAAVEACSESRRGLHPDGVKIPNLGHSAVPELGPPVSAIRPASVLGMQDQDSERALSSNVGVTDKLIPRATSDDRTLQQTPIAAQEHMSSAAGPATRGAKTKGTFTITQAQLRKLKRTFMEAAMAEAEAYLKLEWDSLPKDAATSQLLALRYGAHQRVGQCHDRLRSALDNLISSQNASAKAAVAAEAGPRAPSGNGGPCAQPSVDRVDVRSAQLPHPALLFLEYDPAVASSWWTRAENTAGDAGAAASPGSKELPSQAVDVAGRAEAPDKADAPWVAALRRYLSLGSEERAALWCIAANRARCQERALHRAFEIQGGTTNPRGFVTGVSGFDVFRRARAGNADFLQARSTGARSQFAAAEDPLSQLEVEAEFLGQSAASKRACIRHAAMQDGSSQDWNMTETSNWKPESVPEL